MGEVVEISLKAETYEAFYLLLTELKKYTTNNVESKIEIMDNWEYENKFSVDSIKDIEKYINDKIIFVTIKSSDNYVGVTLEKIKNEYIIEGWINPHNFIDEDNYRIMINRFVELLKEKKSIILGGIGRETLIDFDKDICSMIKESSGVDIWLVRNEDIKNIYNLNINYICLD